MLYRKPLIFLLLLLPLSALFSQEKKEYYHEVTDSTQVIYMIIEGDTIPRKTIDLNEVVLLGKIDFESNEARKKYLLLKRRTRKVYPYAKLAADRLYTMNRVLDSVDSKRLKRKYTKRIQRYIEEEFTEELKKLTKTEGKILIKLIHRQTGESAFELVKNLRTGWRAFWYNTTASVYNLSLKEEYAPEENKEDFLIEDILQRAFQEGALELQNPAFPIDYFKLADKWLKPE